MSREELTARSRDAIYPASVISDLDLVWDNLSTEDKKEVIKILGAALNYGMSASKAIPVRREGYNDDRAIVNIPHAYSLEKGYIPRSQGKLAGADYSAGDILRAQGIAPLF